MLEISFVKKSPPPRTDLLDLLKTYLRTMLTTTYLFHFAIFNILFLVNGWVVVYVARTYFPSILTNGNLLNIFSQVAFLPNLVYIMFIQGIFSGWTDPIVFYYAYLQIAHKISMICDVSKLKKVVPALFILIDLGDYLREEQLPASYSALKATYPAVVQLKERMGGLDFNDGLKYVICYLRHVLGRGDAAVSALDELLSIQQDIEKNNDIAEPSFFNNQNTMLLFAWYCIWFPISLCIIAGQGPTIMLYPFLSYILWSPAILRLWLGSAFSNNRPFEDKNEHENWPDQFKKKIEATVKMRLEIARVFRDETEEPEMRSVSGKAPLVQAPRAQPLSLPPKRTPE